MFTLVPPLQFRIFKMGSQSMEISRNNRKSSSNLNHRHIREVEQEIKCLQEFKEFDLSLMFNPKAVSPSSS
jgi:N-acetyl-gamma-glutamylphosphate reductase